MADVFRVLYRDGKPFVAKRELIERRGSWSTLKCSDGTIVKENGHDKWSQTILHAIQREAEYIMWRHGMPTVFDQSKQVDSLDALIVEAMEWGKLLGAINGMGQQHDSVESDRAATESARLDELIRTLNPKPHGETR